jgi:hypothetical protein
VAEPVEPGTYFMKDSQKEFSIAAVFKDRQMGITSRDDVKETPGKYYSEGSCHIKE